MFIGAYRHTLDEKNRIIVPSRFRSILQGRFIATRGLDGCLACYPTEEFEKYMNGLAAMPIEHKEARKYIRIISSNAVECEIDKQGRVVLPQGLRDAARIDKEIVVVGANNRFEIWSASEFDRYEEETLPQYEQLAEGLAGMGSQR